MNPKENLNPVEWISARLFKAKWMKVVALLANVVVFCTVYALILPAITMSSQQAKCGIEEHTHTAECYDAEGRLICIIEEHVHSLACYADLYEDIESENEWTADLPNLTGNAGKDMIAVASSQIGYRESDTNYLVSDNQTMGYTRYGHWYGDTFGYDAERMENGLNKFAYADWDAAFVSFVLNYAGIQDFGFDYNTDNWVEALSDAGIYVEALDYMPKPGNLIFFSPEAGANVQVGIVSSVNRSFFGLGKTVKSVSVILGNSDNSVAEVKVMLSDGTNVSNEIVHGYGILPENNEDLTDSAVTTAEDVSNVDDISNVTDNAFDTIPADVPETELAQEHFGNETSLMGDQSEESQVDIDEIETQEESAVEEGVTVPSDTSISEDVLQNESVADVSLNMEALADEFAEDSADVSEEVAQNEQIESELPVVTGEASVPESAENVEDSKNEPVEPTDQNWVLRDAGLDETGHAAKDTEEDEALVGSAIATGSRTLVATGNDYTVTLTFGRDAGIPEVAKLKVSEIKQGTKEYEEYLEEAKKAAGINENKSPDFRGRFFDIKIITKDGEFEPEASVKVDIQYAQAIEDVKEEDINAVHFSEDGAVAMNVVPSLEDGEINGVAFEAESFSIYGVVYTVDFSYNGYTWSMAGNSKIVLSQLAESLGLAGDVEDVKNGEEAKHYKSGSDFVAHVTDVSFSNYNLLSVEKVTGKTTLYTLYEENLDPDATGEDFIMEGSSECKDTAINVNDYILTSLISFDSNEKLTIHMQDGTSYVIDVTDPSDPSNGIWDLTDSEVASTIDASVSTAITSKEQERDVSFYATVNYMITSAALEQMKSYYGGYPALTYDLSDWLSNQPADLQNMSGRIRSGFTTIGNYAIKDGVVTLTITNLAWLRSQDTLRGSFQLSLSADEDEVGLDDEWTFTLPGTDDEITIPFKKIDFSTTKTVTYDGYEDSRGAFVTQDEDGNYYLRYTASITTPVDLDSLQFIDKLRGSQTLESGTITVNGSPVSIESQTSGTDEDGEYTQFTLQMPKDNNKVQSGTYLVEYTTKITAENVAVWSESGSNTEDNESDWKANGTKDIPGEDTHKHIVKEEPEEPEPNELTVTKTVNNSESLTGKTNGDVLNYSIVFGQGATSDKSATPMGGAMIHDYMTDTQKLNGDVTITLPDGYSFTMPVSNDWGAGVNWSDDGAYSTNNTELFRYTLPASPMTGTDGQEHEVVGPITVSYSTTIISKEEAVASNIWGSASADNYAESGNANDYTTVTTEMPTEPTIGKTVNGVSGDAGTFSYNQTLNYRLTYGSKDVLLNGANITDYMTGLQNLTSPVTITFADGSSITMPTATNGWDTGSGVVWNAANGSTFSSYTENEVKVFDYTFASDLNKYGPVTITYTTKTLSKNDAENTLDLYGNKEVNNTFRAGGKSAITTGDIPTQTPMEVSKIVKDSANTNEITEAQPGDTIVYTATFGESGQDMSDRVLYDRMTNIQDITADGIIITFGDGTSVTLHEGDTGYLFNGDRSSNKYTTGSTNVLEYTVPEGKTGPITVTYSVTLADKDTLNSLGYYETIHAENHATSDKGGNGDTDVRVDYGKKPVPFLGKTAVNTSRAEGEDWQPGDVIKWVVTYGDSTTDMRGKVLSDSMVFLQTLNADPGVTVYYGTEDSYTSSVEMAVTSESWKNNGIVFWTDGNVNNNNYGNYEVPVYNYTVENGDTAIMGPITIVYYTTIIGSEDAWAHNVTGVTNIWNKGIMGDLSTTTGEDTDFDNPPDPSPKKEVESIEKAEGNTENETAEPGDTLNYVMKYGNDYTTLNGVRLSDSMTETQTLVGSVHVKLELAEALSTDVRLPGNIALATGETVYEFDMPTSNYQGSDVYDGVKWGYNHEDGTYTNNMLQVFAYELSSNKLGNGTVTVTYSAKLMTEEEAKGNGLFSVQNVNNTWYVNWSNSPVTVPVTYPEEPEKEVTKAVTNVTLADDESREVSADNDNWEPDDVLEYSMTFGYDGMIMNGVNMYDRMTDIQHLKSEITVSYFDANGTEQSFVMPTASSDNGNNGVRWQEDTNYSAQIRDVFNYTFPQSTDINPDTGNPYGKILGIVTISYTTKVISPEEALNAKVWDAQYVDNTFTAGGTSVNTRGLVPFDGEPVHDADVIKSGLMDKETGEPVFDTNDENAVNNIVRNERTVYWSVKVDTKDGSSFPLENILVWDDYYSVQINGQFANHLGLDTGKPSQIIDFTKTVVTTESGTVLSPGVDYKVYEGDGETLTEYGTASIDGYIYWYFAKIDEPVIITFPAVYPADFNGYVELSNRVYMKQGNDQSTSTGTVKETYTDVGISKTGTYDAENEEILWTVVLNPSKQTFSPDVSKIVFEDTLPEGTELVKYYDDDRDVYIHVEYNGDTKYNDHGYTDYGKNYNWVYNNNGEDTGHDIEYAGTHVQDTDKGFKVDITTYQTWAPGTKIGLSGQMYTIKYKTKVTNIDEITSSPDGKITYDNTVLFTDEDSNSWSGEGSYTIEAENPLNKYEIDEDGNPLPEVEADDDETGSRNKRYYKYRIEVNPDSAQYNNGSPMKLSDYIDTDIDIDPTSVKIYDNNRNMYTTDASYPADIKPKSSYIDDSRMLTIENLQDKTYYTIEYLVRFRAMWTEDMESDPDQFTVTNTVTLEGANTWQDSVTGEHKVKEASAEMSGAISLLKVDADDTNTTLEGAVFKIFKVDTDIVLTTDEEGRVNGFTGTGAWTDPEGTQIGNPDGYTSDENGVVSFGDETYNGFDGNFEEFTLYYWIETKGPNAEGYLDPDPTDKHYFVVYYEDLADLEYTGVKRNVAWYLDEAWQKANDIQIANLSKGTSWTANNSKTRSIRVTKRWADDYWNLYKTRPDSVTINLIRISVDGTREKIASTVLKPDSNGDWLSYTNYQWTGLAAFENNDPEKPYKYTVEEEKVNGKNGAAYLTEYSDGQEGVTSGSVTVTNRLMPSETEITVEKLWEGTDENAPESITLTLQRILTDADGNVGTAEDATDISGYVVTLTKNELTNKWKYTWTGLPTKDGEGGTYTYTVKETVPKGYKVVYSDKGKGIFSSTDEDPLTITNTAVGDLKISKTFTGIDPSQVTNKEALIFTVKNSENATVATFTYKDMVAGTYTVKDLPTGTYIVSEAGYDEAAPDGYEFKQCTVSVENGEVAVVKDDTAEVSFENEYSKKLGSLKITKVLNQNGSETLSDNVKILLAGTYSFGIYTNEACTIAYQEGGIDKVVTITVESDGASVTSEEVKNMEPGDYWIKEINPTNGSAPVENPVKVTVEGGKTGENAVIATITNNINTGSITVKKTKSGDSVTKTVFKVALKEKESGQYYSQDGTSSETVTWIEVTADDATGVTWTNLPAGKTYVVEEDESDARVTDYSLTVTGTGDVALENSVNATADAVVNNDYTQLKTDVSVTKIWKDSDAANVAWDPEVDELTFFLTRQKASVDDETFGTVTITVTNGLVTSIDPEIAGVTAATKLNTDGTPEDGYIVTVSGLDKVYWDETDSEYKEYRYFFSEDAVNNYNTSYELTEGGTVETGKIAAGGKIINTPVDAIALPNTGGSGTNMLYLAGALLILIAGFGIIMKKRTIA